MIEKHLLHGQYKAACDVLSFSSPEAQDFVKACPPGCEESYAAATATVLAEEIAVRLLKKITLDEAENKQ
eukprot:761727-Lingulodinium_polyedra.AAC.1